MQKEAEPGGRKPGEQLDTRGSAQLSEPWALAGESGLCRTHISGKC